MSHNHLTDDDRNDIYLLRAQGLPLFGYWGQTRPVQKHDQQRDCPQQRSERLSTSTGPRKSRGATESQPGRKSYFVGAVGDSRDLMQNDGRYRRQVHWSRPQDAPTQSS